MCVHTASSSPCAYDAGDFVVYRFAPTHPQANRRVQLLRVDMPFKVPRLFGFTLAPPKKPKLFQNALGKSVLRPIAATASAEPAEDFLPLVDDSGCFVGPWQKWFAEQRHLNENYEGLEAKAGKVFTIADVDVSPQQFARDMHDVEGVTGDASGCGKTTKRSFA